MSHKMRILAARFELGDEGIKKDGKKVTKGLYFTLGRSPAPTQAICIKNCVAGNLLDVITRTKFQHEIFRGYHFTSG